MRFCRMQSIVLVLSALPHCAPAQQGTAASGTKAEIQSGANTTAPVAEIGEHSRI